MAADLGIAVLTKYFAETEFALTRHHLDSYEQCMFEEIPSIIASSNPIVLLKGLLDKERGIYAYRMEIFIGPTAERPENKFSIAPPVIVLDGGQTVRRMFPNEARLRNLTYAAQVNADIFVRFTMTEFTGTPPVMTLNEMGEPVTRVEEKLIAGFPLFRMPVLLRSSLCATGIPDPALLEEMGECRNDYGGYFIIGGAEKVLITRGEQAFNSLYVEKNKTEDDKVAAYASVVSLDPKTKQTRRVAIYVQRGGEIRVAIPMVRGTFPLFILFRAMGVESDEDIVRMIFPEPTPLEDTLIPSIVDAYPIYSKFTATEFIKTLTKGFSQAQVLDILNNLMLAHVLNEPLARAQYLAEMVREALLANAGLRAKTDRDDMRNQRFLPTGVLVRELFNGCWKDWRAALALQLDTIYNTNDAVQGPNMMRMFERPVEVFQPGVLNKAIMRGFRGRWGTSEFNEKSGVLQPLARISYLDATSHTRRVVSDFDTSSKITGPRKLHTSQVGYFCTSETPTGSHIGATKNMSMMTQFSIGADTQPVYDWMRMRGWVVPVAETTAADRAAFSVVQINGGTIGFTTQPTELVAVLRLMKWNACISPTASISFNTTDRTVRILLDEGRPVRPLWHLPLPETTDKPWAALVFGTRGATSLRSVRFFDPLGDREATVQDYVDELTPTAGYIEYCDPMEMNEAYVSWWSAAATEAHTHAEIHPSTLTGLLASMIPYSNHNQAPRNQLSCSQSKQGIGTMVTNISGRYETYAHQMCYGEAPICRTLMYETVGRGEMAYGFNCIIAATSESGYNQDDGLIINRDSVERGMFQSLSFRSYDCAEETDPMTKANSHIASPWADGKEDWAKGLRPGLDYGEHLDERGIVREGTYINDKTVLVARYMEVPRDDGTIEVKDASITAGLYTEGRVDSVVVLYQNDGQMLVKVRVIQIRLPQLGDKFSSRHGQKGTIGMLVSSTDLPRTAEGLVPDVMVNPGGLISRMTVAQLVEMVAGRLGAELAMKMSATTFGNDGSYVGQLGDLLQAAGCSRTGDNVLYSGITGEQIRTDIFMCPLYFMRLKHLTDDKVNARGAGRREIRTHQPTGGRANEGGLRIGEMERDSLCAHGVSTFLQESMMRRGDGTEFWICNGCGRVPIYNEAERLYVCPTCDGPLTFTGDDADSLMLQLPTVQSRTTYSKVAIPYSLKLLDQELTGLGNIGFRFVTAGAVGRLREDWDWPLEILPVEQPEEAAVARPVVPPPAVTSVAAATAAAAPVVIDPVDAANPLSMYAATPFTYYGREYPTLEHFYQTERFPTENLFGFVEGVPPADVRATVIANTGPTYYERKELTTPDEKTEMLRTGLRAKFAANPEALVALKATGARRLVAEYDGVDLGALLEEIRVMRRVTAPPEKKQASVAPPGGGQLGGAIPLIPQMGGGGQGMYFIINPDMRAGVEAKARAPRQRQPPLTFDEPQQGGGGEEMITETKFNTVVTVEKEE
jgi:DNA-directed RNA polymerase II subunit RPB2